MSLLLAGLPAGGDLLAPLVAASSAQLLNFLRVEIVMGLVVSGLRVCMP